MNTSGTFACLFTSSLLIGCSGKSGYLDPSASGLMPYNSQRGEMGDAPAAGSLQSLFASDQAVMSNEDIEVILSSHVTLPEAAKMVIVRYGPAYRWYGWSEELAFLDRAATGDFVGKLRDGGKLRDASVLPSMLMPRAVTIPYLREAAARTQADLILVYRTSTQSYQKSRFLKRDQTRAYCTVEAAVLDTRSGIVTFTTAATENFSAERAKKDMNFWETMARAEQEALGKAMGKVADDVVSFLNSPGARGEPAAGVGRNHGA